MSFLMAMVDVPLCSPPISGGRCILLEHFQLPIMLFIWAISGGGAGAAIASPPDGFLAGVFSCATANGVPKASAKTENETRSVIRSCLRQRIGVYLLVDGVRFWKSTIGWCVQQDFSASAEAPPGVRAPGRSCRTRPAPSPLCGRAPPRREEAPCPRL